MAVLALVLNAHSIPMSPTHGEEINTWVRQMMETFEAATKIQAQLRTIRVSHEWKVWFQHHAYSLPGINPTLRSLLLKKLDSPYIASSDEDALIDDYVRYTATLQDGTTNIESESAKVAHLYGFALISARIGHWDSCFLNGNLIAGEGAQAAEWKNVANHVHPAECHLDYFERLAKPELPKSTTLPGNKRVYFQDHHGKDELADFAPQLRNSPYVEEIESGEWKSQSRRFVYKIYQHQNQWWMHLVMYKTSKGYSFLVRTTAHNKYEAELIGEELTKLYR